jgi:hypothetical protein
MRTLKRHRIARWMERTVFVAGLLAGPVVSLAGQQMAGTETSAEEASDRALVERFFPQRLQDEQPGPNALPLTARYGFVAADLNGTGQREFLVAVYSAAYSDSVELRVLRKTVDSARPAGRLSLDCRGGMYPKVSLINLDRSGTPEILVQLVGGRTAIEWLFKWNGTALSPFGPMKDYPGEGPCTVLQDASFVDLDGDGVLEIVDSPPYNIQTALADAPSEYRIYRLADGTYKYSGSFEYFSGFSPPGAVPPPPRFRTQRFSATAPGSPYLMVIANGNGRHKPPAHSAEVRLNGELVPGTERISERVRYLTIPVAVNAADTVDVTVSGPADSELYIGIGPVADFQTAHSQ